MNAPQIVAAKLATLAVSEGFAHLATEDGCATRLDWILRESLLRSIEYGLASHDPEERQALRAEHTRLYTRAEEAIARLAHEARS